MNRFTPLTFMLGLLPATNLVTAESDDHLFCTSSSMQKQWKCNMKGEGKCIWLFSTEECIDYNIGEDVCKFETSPEHCDVGRGCIYDWYNEVCMTVAREPIGNQTACDGRKSKKMIEDLELMVDQYEDEANAHVTTIESLKAEIEFRTEDIKSLEQTIVEIKQQLSSVPQSNENESNLEGNVVNPSSSYVRPELRGTPHLPTLPPHMSQQNYPVPADPVEQNEDPNDVTISESPTADQTNEITKAPTAPPTRDSSTEPSIVPTNYPTLSPTQSPSKEPSNAPTHPPTRSPTQKPTGKPSNAPTNPPTLPPLPPLDVLAISRSYVIDPTYPNFLRPSKHIFDYSTRGVIITPSNFHETSDRSYRSSSEAENEMRLNFGLEGEYNGFSAAASVSTESLNKKNKKYTRLDHTISAAMKQVTVNELYPHRRLKSHVRKYLLEESPENILRNIGPFYARSLKLGAVFQLSVVGITTSDEQSNRFQNEFSGKFSTLMQSISFDQSSDVSSASTDSCVETTTEYFSRGGNSKIWLTKTKSMDDVLDEWKASITDENQYPVDHKLEYIWKLLDHEEMNPEKAIEVKNYMVQKWMTESEEVDLIESQLTLAKDHREKKVTGDVVIKQPSEEQGSYRSRSITKSACEFIEGRDKKNDGKWNLDSLYCKDGSRCLKWGNHCYAGRIDLPDGVKVKTYRDFGLREGKSWFHGPTNGDKNYWNYHDRTCGFRFFLEEGYTCDSNPKCTL